MFGQENLKEDPGLKSRKSRAGTVLGPHKLGFNSENESAAAISSEWCLYICRGFQVFMSYLLIGSGSLYFARSLPF